MIFSDEVKLLRRMADWDNLLDSDDSDSDSNPGDFRKAYKKKYGEGDEDHLREKCTRGQLEV